MRIKRIHYFGPEAYATPEVDPVSELKYESAGAMQRERGAALSTPAGPPRFN